MSFGLLVRFFAVGMLLFAILGFFFTILWFISFFIAFYVLGLVLFNDDGGFAYSLHDHFLNPAKNLAFTLVATIPTALIWLINDKWLGVFPL